MPTVVVTGAGSGIGRAAARRFASGGWRCVLVDRHADALARVRAEMGPRDHAVLALDLTDAREVQRLAGLPGPVDAVVNNAGRSDPSGTPLADQDITAQAGLAALNLAAPAAVVDALDARLVPGARIVNVSSGAGLRAIPFRGLYSPTKAGLIAQSRALAAARPDLVVTVVCPGFVRTELVDGLIAAGRLDARRAIGKTPLGRMAEPAEVAELMVFLASPQAAVVRGQVIALCGGSSVYGGSGAVEPAVHAGVPIETPSALTVVGDATGRWGRLLATDAGAAPGAYPAVVDVSALEAGTAPACGGPPVGPQVASVHAAVRRFARGHVHTASLTLLLPAERPRRWQDAGDGAAARMLVATLACELADRALRVNAITVGTTDDDPDLDGDRAGDAASIAALVVHVAGAGSQFMTGQTLAACPRTERTTP